MDVLLPYSIVCGVAFLIALAELLKSFGGNWLLTVKSGWAYILVAVNLAVAAATYTIARQSLNIGSDLFLAAVVGVLYPVLLRSRFTFFRPVGSKDDPQLSTLSVHMDTLYSALQERCYRQVDNAVAVRRTLRARTLASRSEADLIRAIQQVIAARQLPAEREKDEKYLDELRQVPDKERRRFQIALFLIEIADGKEDRLLP